MIKPVTKYTPAEADKIPHIISSINKLNLACSDKHQKTQLLLLINKGCDDDTPEFEPCEGKHDG